jgi:hypothetical protein
MGAAPGTKETPTKSTATFADAHVQVNDQVDAPSILAVHVGKHYRFGAGILPCITFDMSDGTTKVWTYDNQADRDNDIAALKGKYTVLGEGPDGPTSDVDTQGPAPKVVVAAAPADAKAP